MAAIKRDKRDKVFSDLVRTLAGWRCERCGTYYPEGQRQGLHCSHLFSRRHKGTRWDTDNAFAHCYGCHSFLGGNPILFYEWAKAKMGESKFNLVRLKANKVTKFTKWDLEVIHGLLKKQLKEAQA